MRFKARETASQVRLNAYAPYSKFQVGAAVVSASSGTIYHGCNVENSSYGATICAERGALMEAVAQEGDFRIDMVVVVSDDNPPAPPCALCLQVLAEFAADDTVVHLYDTKGNSETYRFDELLPHPFIFPTQRDRR
ncbi:MAG: cytidine deaminase [Spirochaetes bacterium GWC2_52_13]|nr:MAG: cytidine deaminase [Spirochaetes bacterium GWC2_52_13]